MTIRRLFQRHALRALTLGFALLSVCWSGCATTGSATPFGLASQRTPAPVAAPSQYANPGTPVAPPADGYSTQFASASTGQARPQRRYTAPRCNSAVG